MPSFAKISFTLLAAIQLVAGATYTLTDNYDQANFFDNFDFFSEADPTNGFVQYQNRINAASQGLAGFHKDMIYVGSDHKTVDPANGRASTRINSKKTYTQMLLVADVVHMPVGCGTWPALWTYNADWPNKGEIDIIEGVNSQQSNQVTLHTAAGCTMTKGNTVDGTELSETGDCNAGSGGTGCPQTTNSTSNFGKGLNAQGGGVYAMLWDNEAISVWFFPRNSTMQNRITSSNSTIDPTTFGTPLASFVGGSTCNIENTFKEHWITINTDFCGQWAGLKWSEDAECAAKAATCEEYAAQDPNAFVDAYWLFNSIKVYSKSGSTGTPTPTTTGFGGAPTAYAKRGMRFMPREYHA
ncbi:glycoside hydrolase family 16 protein [Diaporthe amygdali]|uniref:glycoside hydrolase family 16 protein n=1 Tax=Phomopsis amygdali TaxID=1214568 RepID=UPI0022FF2F08|nr:glycoside hydrolase family 16 protein [Diaporthe amygdali]KAJ0121472.1 glycoside hydrolase family 16 protein [Diaporthe amygdali]